jgi:hypothetical protein
MDANALAAANHAAAASHYAQQQALTGNGVANVGAASVDYDNCLCGTAMPSDNCVRSRMNNFGTNVATAPSNVATPSVATPSVAVPNVATPGVAVPAVRVPNVAVPGVAVPSVRPSMVAIPAGAGLAAGR